jgi:enamine deaminase RidA (YjgF/YER057c/UK114 family)
MFFSGKTTQVNGVIVTPGKVGKDLTTEEGETAAKVCAINLLSQIEHDIGLENVSRILKLTGFVASAENFFSQPKVIDGASHVFVDVLGARGQHARSAIGVAALPGNSSVEIEVIIQTRTIGA